jgi:hypothetical protein
MQKIVNAAPTREGNRVQGMISALVSAGLDGGYLASPRLAKVHWQAGDRTLPAPRVTVAGESALWVDPAEIPPTATSASSAGRWPSEAGHGAARDCSCDVQIRSCPGEPGLCRWHALPFPPSIIQSNQDGRDGRQTYPGRTALCNLGPWLALTVQSLGGLDWPGPRTHTIGSRLP